MLVKVDTVQTIVSTVDFIKAFSLEWRKIYGALPHKENVAVVWAQHQIETGGKNCWCYNLANYKAVDTPGQTIKYCALKGVFEFVNGVRVEIPSDNPGSWFRAFDSLQEGMSFYISSIMNGRYKASWSAIEAGSPENFAHILRQYGYYTAPEADYIKGLRYNFDVFMRGSSFDVAMQEIQAEDNATVEFPSDWHPFTVAKTNYPGFVVQKSKSSLLQSLIAKIKCFFA